MEDIFDYQDDTLVMFHCRRCGWMVCCDSDDGWLVDAARQRVVDHVQGHGVLSESEEVLEDRLRGLRGLAGNHPALAGAGVGGSDEPIMAGVEGNF